MQDFPSVFDHFFNIMYEEVNNEIEERFEKQTLASYCISEYIL